MNVTESQSGTHAHKAGWFRFTPGHCLATLLALECILLLSDRFDWFTFNEKKGWTPLIAAVSVGIALLSMLVWFVGSLLLRGRFQLSVRSLMVLFIVVALPCSWLATEVRHARKQKEIVESIEELGGSAYPSEPSPSNGGSLLYTRQPSSAGPEWLRLLLGDEFFEGVACVLLDSTQVTDAQLMHLAGLTHLRELHLGSTQITDAGMAYLKGLSELKVLNLDGTTITDAGLKHLRELPQLQSLNLSRTSVTDRGMEDVKHLDKLRDLELMQVNIGDAGLKHVGGLTELRRLNLYTRNVTDAGLKNLEGLNRLQVLTLEDTKVTDDGLKHLKKMSQLRVLWLNGAPITGVGFDDLKGLNQLRVLVLTGTRISDVELDHLTKLPQLQEVCLHSTRVTDKGVSQLQRALPNCKIVK